ncbi:MAG: VWA domain-containing protein [Deltaproteobacteria bacterium]|nr:VWA domain-containing protein [Deltaproteobacteria bacterium]
MSFARMWVLHFLWLVPGSALLLLIRARLEKRALERLADPGLLPRLAGTPRKGLRLFRGAFQVLGLGFMVLALAGPRWGSRYQEVHRKGVDIMVVVDISSSMRVADVKPNRLERSRREVRDFLRVVKGDRVGLVAFSGAAFVQCPLTLDYAALEMFLGALEPGLIPVPGTDLGAALDTALSAFDMQKETDRVILLITDGEDHEGKGLEAAGRASEKEVRVYVFGVGDPAGGPVPGEEGGFRKDREGKMILSRLREASLREIASATGGRYVRSRAGDLDLDLLYFNGIKRDTQDAELKSGKIRVREERFALFALAAFVLLLLAGCLRDRDRGVTAALVLWATLCLLNPFPAQAGPGAEELYRQGRYEEAERAYAREDMDHPREVPVSLFRLFQCPQAYQGSPGAVSGGLQPGQRRLSAGGLSRRSGPLQGGPCAAPGRSGCGVQPGTGAEGPGPAETGREKGGRGQKEAGERAPGRKGRSAKRPQE